MHHARHTASDLQFLPTWGADAAMLLLCLWAAAVKMNVCLDWGFGTCKREFVEACVCTSINQIKQICCVFVGWVAALKMKVRLGLRFWQMQKGIGSSLCLHIHKSTNLPRVLQKKTPIRSRKNSFARQYVCPACGKATKSTIVTGEVQTQGHCG